MLSESISLSIAVSLDLFPHKNQHESNLRIHKGLEHAGANRSLPMFASPIDPIALLESPPMQAWPGREQNVVSLFEG